MTRTFDLIRDVDVSGISGTGKVAEGTEYSDGVCTMHWLTQWNSTTVYPDIDHVVNIHSHEGATRIVWHDRPDELQAVVRKLVEVAAIDMHGDYIGFADDEYSAPNDMTARERAAYQRAIDKPADA